MDKYLDYYISKFSNLNTDSSPKKYSFITKYKAPHKPILLLSVIDLIEEKTIKSNFIELSQDLGELFKIYWSIVMPIDKRGNIALPFYHLTSDKFWRLLPQTGKENILKETAAIRSIYKLLEITIGGRFDDELFILLCNEKTRNILRSVILECYFDQTVTESILAQSKINIGSYYYSLELLQSKHKVKELLDENDLFKNKIRDQGFRKAIVTAYDHRCAICGIRMRTPDGHTVVDGAHIIPWSISKDDNPCNGISLCRLCHWTFDEGLVSITNDYTVISSLRLNSAQNFAGHLITLEGRAIIKPTDKILWPSINSLDYHRKKILRKI